MSVWFGYNPPFQTSSFFLPFQTDERLIKNDLLQLLLTSPGERVMRPDFGSPIKNFLFSPLTVSDLDALKAGISNAIFKYEPRISISKINIVTDESKHLINIVILAKITMSNEKTIELRLNFDSEV